MFAALRSSAARSSLRAFSTSRPAHSDLAKLTLIGRLGADPVAKLTKNDKEYVSYTVATVNYPPPPPNPDGSRAQSSTTWHRVVSFNEYANKYLRTLRKGSVVYVEANFELREPDAEADPSTPQGQRQIFLRHEIIRLISPPKNTSEDTEVTGF